MALVVTEEEVSIKCNALAGYRVCWFVQNHLVLKGGTREGSFITGTIVVFCPNSITEEQLDERGGLTVVGSGLKKMIVGKFLEKKDSGMRKKD